MPASPWPTHLLTLAEFAALPEDNSRHYELEEGVLVVSPRPAALHQRVLYRLQGQLNEQLPAEWEALGELEVVVEPRNPATLRVPDIVVVSADETRAQVQAAGVRLVVEIISPGSRRRDTRAKPYDYAEAGIPHYWVVDLDPPASVITYHRLGTYYGQDPPALHELVVSEPFPLRIDIAALIAPR